MFMQQTKISLYQCMHLRRFRKLIMKQHSRQDFIDNNFANACKDEDVQFIYSIVRLTVYHNYANTLYPYFQHEIHYNCVGFPMRAIIINVNFFFKLCTLNFIIFKDFQGRRQLLSSLCILNFPALVHTPVLGPQTNGYQQNYASQNL